MFKKIIMFKVLSISILLFFSVPFQGQNPVVTLKNPLNSEESTLYSQHKFIMQQSTTYDNNKVVKTQWMKKFYSNLNDSLELVKHQSSNFEKAYSAEIKVSKAALKSITTLKKELAIVNFEKEGISFFGSLISKTLYKAIVWIIIMGLLAFLLFFLFKFKNSNNITIDAREKLKEIEFELEETKKKSRIKEQELMRKLQDEINSNS